MKLPTLFFGDLRQEAYFVLFFQPLIRRYMIASCHRRRIADLLHIRQ